MDEELITLQSKLTERGLRSFNKETRGFLNPSGASIMMSDEITGEMRVFGQCMRRRWYKYNRQTEDAIADPVKDLNGLMRMRWGNVISDDISEGFKELGLLVGTEIPIISHEMKFSGRIDRITIDPQYGTFVGWEDKAYFTYYSIKGAFGNKSEAPSVRLGYKLQTALYAWFTEEYDVSDWRILHTDTNNGRMRQDFIRLINGNQIVINNKPEPWTIEDIWEREEVWHDIKNNDEAPQRDFELQYSKTKLAALSAADQFNKTERELYKKGQLNKGDFECRFCPFKTTCWSN